MDIKKSDMFPEDYPSDLYDRIIEDGAGENTFEVYRISNVGTNCRDAFLCSYHTNKSSSNLNNRDAYVYKYRIGDNYDIGLFSTSCFDEQKAANKILRLIEKRVDSPKMLRGTTAPEHGLSMRTIESKSGRKSKKHHIDWWIYKDTDPSINFYEVEVEQDVYSKTIL